MKVFLKQLKTLNPNMEFESTDYNEHSCMPWINYMKGDKNSIMLPKGAYWVDKNHTHIQYKDHLIQMVPMVERLI